MEPVVGGLAVIESDRDKVNGIPWKLIQNGEGVPDFRLNIASLTSRTG
jgi:hypothetical protein